jgi:phosphotransferase system enzyme I (PtsI)
METPSTSATAAASEPAPVLLRGTSVAGGFALGRAQRSGQDLGAKPSTRVPKDQVPRELTRLQAALEAARAELDQLRAELPAAVPEDHARVLQTHATLLGDAVFLADVEKLIVE